MADADDQLPKRRPSANDVEIEKIRGRRAIWLKVVGGLSTALTVAAFGVPAYVLRETLVFFAGADTKIELGIGVTLSVSVAASGVSALVTHWAKEGKCKKQREELTEVRVLNQDLERERDRLLALIKSSLRGEK